MSEPRCTYVYPATQMLCNLPEGDLLHTPPHHAFRSPAPSVVVTLERLTEAMARREVERATKFPYLELYRNLDHLEEDARLLFAELQKEQK